jgi:hypothetical protein
VSLVEQRNKALDAEDLDEDRDAHPHAVASWRQYIARGS